MELVRGFNAQQKAALRSSVFYPNLLIFVDWPGDPLRFNMSDSPLTVGGLTYAAFGPAASLSLPAETMDIIASTASLSIAGVDHELDSQLDSPVRGKAVQVYLGLMTGVSKAELIGPPVRIFQGTIGSSRMRTSSVAENQLLSKIEVDLSTGPSARAKSSIFHSNEDQKKRYPSDTAGRLTILAFSNAQKLRWPE